MQDSDARFMYDGTLEDVLWGPPSCPDQTSCFTLGVHFEPLNMKGQERIFAGSVTECQAWCVQTADCRHFAFWPDGGCHLQDRSALALRTETDAEANVVAGPPFCSHALDPSDQGPQDLSSSTRSSSRGQHNVTATAIISHRKSDATGGAEDRSDPTGSRTDIETSSSHEPTIISSESAARSTSAKASASAIRSTTATTTATGFAMRPAPMIWTWDDGGESSATTRKAAHLAKARRNTTTTISYIPGSASQGATTAPSAADTTGAIHRKSTGIAEGSAPSFARQHAAASTTLGSRLILFCFSYAHQHTYEAVLIKAQLKARAGIFGCDDWMVLSDVAFVLARKPNMLKTSAITSALDAGMQASQHPQTVHEEFQVLEADGRWKRSDLIVKVAPDAVFFPSRLQKLFEADPHVASRGTFFANCAAQDDVQAKERPHFMYDPLQVFTKAAITAYFFGGTTFCHNVLRASGPSAGARYVTACLEGLGIRMETDFSFNLLRDKHCDDGRNPSPCVADSVAFHNFSSTQDYFACRREAQASESRDKGLVVANKLKKLL